MLRKSLVAVVVVLTTTLFAGCSAHSATPVQTAGGSSKVPTATATPTPTIHVMTVEEAGKFYLAAVCPTNKVKSSLKSALTAQNLTTIQQAAAATRDAERTEVTQFTNTDVLWPPVVSSADVKLLSDSDFASISILNEMATAGTLDSANALSNTFVDNGAGAASQRIRLVLNLPADTSAGC